MSNCWQEIHRHHIHGTIRRNGAGDDDIQTELMQTDEYLPGWKITLLINAVASDVADRRRAAAWRRAFDIVKPINLNLGRANPLSTAQVYCWRAQRKPK